MGLACWCRGLAGPETSSDEDDDEIGGGTGGLASSSDDEEDMEGRLGGSSDEEEEGEGEDVEALHREWGVGALAANPDEQARRGPGVCVLRGMAWCLGVCTSAGVGTLAAKPKSRQEVG